MKNIKSFDNFLNEGIFKNLMKTHYLVEYSVTNYKAIANTYYLNKYKDKENVDEWESPIYEFIIKANDSNEAKSEFMKLWSKEASGLEPNPKLNIISAEEVDGDLKKHGMGSFKNKIKLY